MGLTHEQSLAISEHGQNILVSAGAGSGKTKVLSERVFDRICNPKFKWDVDEMLVLTFTNAAAANMKARIRKTILLADESKLSLEEKKKQLNKIDSAYIMTFDAYAQFLVKKYHLLLNVDKDLCIADANIIRNKKAEILDVIMEEQFESGNSEFIHLISSFCVKDGDNIGDRISFVNDKLNTICNRKKYVEEYKERFYSKEAINADIEENTKILLAKVKLINDLLNELSEYVDLNKMYPGISALLQAKTYQEIQNNCEIKVGRIPPNSDKTAINVNKKIKKNLKDLQELTANDEHDFFNEIMATKNDTLKLIELAEVLNDRLEEFKKANNLYEFADVFEMAVKLLDEHKDIRNEIRDGFKEILVDEYQDTNDMQDEFIARISNNNVYMVGDIKQSIYRFRNANPKLFLQKYKDYSDGKGGLKLNLSMNFRSRKEVLDGVNAIFNRLMDEKIGGADYPNGHTMTAGNTGYETEGLGKVDGQSFETEILNYAYDSAAKGEYPFTELDQKDVEAFIIAKDIEDRISSHYQVTHLVKEGDGEVMRTRDVEYRDFTILVDRKTEFERIKQVLTSRGIPVDILTEEDMSESDVMTIVRSFFKMLNALNKKEYKYEFEMAYASLARSFIVEMPDCELYDIVTNRKCFGTDLYNKIDAIARGAENKTISKLLDEFIETFDIYAKVNKIGDVHESLVEIEYLYQLAAALNNTGYSYTDFNDYLVGIFDKTDKGGIQYKMQKEERNAVKITNIHQSKGLEYTICYYPYLTKAFNREEVKDSFVFMKDTGLIIPAMIGNHGLKETIRKKLLLRQYDIEDIGEKIRLFYVALTRAKEKMILVLPIEDKTGSGKTIISDEERLAIRSYKDMLDLVYRDVASYIKTIDFEDYRTVFDKDYKLSNRNIFKDIPSGKEIKVEIIKEIIPKEIRSSSFSKKAGLIDEDTIAKMELGTKLHYYLETMDFSDPSYEGIPEKEVEFIKKFVDSDLMKNAKDAKSYHEYEFIYEVNNERKHGIIDLLMEYDDHFDIIDYKTKNIDDIHYDEQLNGYRGYIESISKKKVNCYLYSLIDSKYREVQK